MKLHILAKANAAALKDLDKKRDAHAFGQMDVATNKIKRQTCRARRVCE